MYDFSHTLLSLMTLHTFLSYWYTYFLQTGKMLILLLCLLNWQLFKGYCNFEGVVILLCFRENDKNDFQN